MKNIDKIKLMHKLCKDILKNSTILVKSIEFKDGELNTKLQKGMDNETKVCSISMVLAMIMMCILTERPIKDQHNREMLEYLFDTIDKTRQALRIGKK